MYKPMTHTGTITIETERLILRRYTLSDAEQMFENWAGDDEVTKFLTWDSHDSVDVTKETLSRWCEGYQNPAFYHWGMELKENGKLIGDISVVNLYEKHLSCEFGYCMSRAYWGKGYMTEAFKALISHMFLRVGVNKIIACHDIKNPASGRVMQKSGLSPEGTFHQQRYEEKRGFIDLAYYSILRSEYTGVKIKNC